MCKLPFEKKKILVLKCVCLYLSDSLSVSAGTCEGQRHWISWS